MNFLRRDTDLVDLFIDTIEWNRIGSENGELDLSDQKLELQHRCLLEEVQELRDAIDDRDKVEVVDALCDILFVASYGVFLLGQTDDNGIDHDLVDNKFELEDLYKQLYWLCNDKKYFTMVQLIQRVSVLFDFNLKKSYKNVVESNYSKFPKVDDIDLHDELEWFNKESKYTDVVAVVVEGRYIFRCWDGDGKIVKPRCFKEPELAQYIG